MCLVGATGSTGTTAPDPSEGRKRGGGDWGPGGGRRHPVVCGLTDHREELTFTLSGRF